MSNGIIFDQDSARRIANATRGYEQGLGEPENVGYQVADGSYGRMMLVRTATLPADYTGSMAAPGNIIEKLPNGTVNVIAPIWIKDINGTALGSDIIYQARFSGSFTQDVTVNGIVTPTTYGLFLVQQAVLPTVLEYQVMRLGLDNNLKFNIPGDSNTYFILTNDIYNGYSVYTNYGVNSVSNIVRSGGAYTGIVWPKLKMKYARKLKYNNIFYNLYVGTYDEPVWCMQSLRIVNGIVQPTFSWQSPINTPVFDPAQIAVKGGPGDYLCQWSLQGYNYFNTTISDSLIVVSKVPTPTTGGIGTGIGSGISGV